MENVPIEFLAQGAAVDAEDVRGAALVALCVAEHGPEQRLLDLAHHEVVEMPRPMAVQAGEVAVERLLGVRTQRDAAAVDRRAAYCIAS